MRKINVGILLFIFLAGALPITASAATAEELKQAIADKAKGLSEINSQILTISKQLEAAQGQKNSLTQQLKSIDYSISQLNLGIKSSQINIDKLGLELQATQLDINDITAAITTKKTAVIELVRELYQKDHESLLMLLLKTKSLAAGFQEGENIKTLNSGLALELQNLKTLNSQLNEKLAETTDKKQKMSEEALNLKARKAIIQDQKSDRQTLLAQTQDQERVYEQQISDLQKKQLEINDEIDAIETELRQSFNQSLLPPKQPGMIAWPLQNPYITQHYGLTPYSCLYYHCKPHNGVDFGAVIGTPVYAVADGTVTAVDNNGRIEYGKYVLIHLGNNLATLYAHLSKNTIVSVGDTVKRGQLIGYSGNTGFVKSSSSGNGAHLHFGLYWDDQSLGKGVQLEKLDGVSGLVPIGVTINPEDYFPTR